MMKYEKKHWYTFLLLWVFHTFFLILSKIILFILIIYLEKTKGLLGISIFGAASILPVMIALPFLGYIIDKIYLKRFFLFVIAIQIPLIYLILTHLDHDFTNFGFIIFLISLSTMFALLENIIFDKLTKLIVTAKKLPTAVSISRLSNAIAYFISPVIAGLAYAHDQLSLVNFLTITTLIMYLAMISLLEKKDPSVSIQKKTHLAYFLKNKRRKHLAQELLFLYAISFIWINAVIIVCLPYFSVFHSTELSSLLITLSGAGGLIINLATIYLPKKTQTLFYCRLSALFSAGMLLLLGMLPPHFISFAIIMFIGGFFSSWCYILSQLISQRVFDAHYLGSFFSLRSWISTALTAIFYLFTGYLLGEVLIPTFKTLSDFLGYQTLNISQHEAIQGLFIGMGSLIILCLISYTIGPFIKTVLLKRRKHKIYKKFE